MKISFYDTFIVQNFKNFHFCPSNYKGIVLKNRGRKLPIFQFYDTFIVQNFKIAHFCPNNYKGIVLKNRVQNQRKSASMILLSSKTL